MIFAARVREKDHDAHTCPVDQEGHARPIVGAVCSAASALVTLDDKARKDVTRSCLLSALTYPGNSHSADPDPACTQTSADFPLAAGISAHPCYHPPDQTPPSPSQRDLPLS